MKYIVIILVITICSCNDKSNIEENYLRHVGDIPFDRNLDDPNFKPCHEDLTFVHYNFNNPDLYEGEKPAIVGEFKDIDIPKSDDGDGYITIRFMVNCKGRTGRFRIEQLDFDYKPKKFNDVIVNNILSKTKSLDRWIPATYDYKIYDYYKYLTFKIIDNQIVDILP